MWNLWKKVLRGNIAGGGGGSHSVLFLSPPGQLVGHYIKQNAELDGMLVWSSRLDLTNVLMLDVRWKSSQKVTKRANLGGTLGACHLNSQQMHSRDTWHIEKAERQLKKTPQLHKPNEDLPRDSYAKRNTIWSVFQASLGSTKSVILVQWFGSHMWQSGMPSVALLSTVPQCSTCPTFQESGEGPGLLGPHQKNR